MNIIFKIPLNVDVAIIFIEIALDCAVVLAREA
jgi:hypothetical protein